MQHRITEKSLTDRTEPQRTTSERLLPEGVLYIRHNDEDYCLRVTRNGKLILTK